MGLGETTINRRKLPRLTTRIPAAARQVSGWLRRGRRLEFDVIDYNRFGAALHSDVRLSPRSQLLLDLNAGHFLLRSVRGEVVSCVRQGRGYRLGVRFYCSGGVPVTWASGELLNVLSGLEESLPEAAAG